MRTASAKAMHQRHSGTGLASRPRHRCSALTIAASQNRPSSTPAPLPTFTIQPRKARAAHTMGRAIITHIRPSSFHWPGMQNLRKSTCLSIQARQTGVE